MFQDNVAEKYEVKKTLSHELNLLPLIPPKSSTFKYFGTLTLHLDCMFHFAQVSPLPITRYMFSSTLGTSLQQKTTNAPGQLHFFTRTGNSISSHWQFTNSLPHTNLPFHLSPPVQPRNSNVKRSIRQPLNANICKNFSRTYKYSSTAVVFTHVDIPYIPLNLSRSGIRVGLAKPEHWVCVWCLINPNVQFVKTCPRIRIQAWGR